MTRINEAREIKEIQLPLPGFDNNTIEADYHILFKEEVQPTFERLDVEDGIGEFYEKVNGFTKYKLFVSDFSDSGKGTQKIVNELQKGSLNGDAFLEIHIASNGGIIDELIEYTNVIQNFYKDTVTYVNYGYSAGAFMFLVGTERVVYEHSSIMFHSYAGGAYGKRDDMLQQLEHTDKRISKFFDKMLKPYFSKKEIKKMEKGKDFWMGAREALQRGIATHIIIDGEVKTADEYLNPKPKKSKKTKKDQKLKNKKSTKKEKAQK